MIRTVVRESVVPDSTVNTSVRINYNMDICALCPKEDWPTV